MVPQISKHRQISLCISHSESLCDRDYPPDPLHKLEALRERRPPWPRQIITPILPNVKMLSLGGDRLRFWIKTYTTIRLCYCYQGIFCSFTHPRIPRSQPKFNHVFMLLCVVLLLLLLWCGVCVVCMCVNVRLPCLLWR